MPNYGGAASGAISGAGAGFGIGGPVGGAIGGLVGGIAGLFGKKKRKKKVSSLDKRQQQLNEQQHQSILGEGPLADLYNYNPEEANAVFEKNIANPAYRNFKEELAPTITGQFRKQGLEDSSYVANALGKAGRDVQEGLDAKRAQYLYSEQKGAREAKRSAVENLQNRQTFAYDSQEEPFDISKVLQSVGPDAQQQIKDFIKNITNRGGK